MIVRVRVVTGSSFSACRGHAPARRLTRPGVLGRPDRYEYAYEVERYLDLLDHPDDWMLTIRLVQTPSPNDPPDEVIQVSLAESSWSHDELLERLYGVLHDEDGQERGPYILSTTRSHYSWGAEAIAVRIVLDIAVSVGSSVAGSAAYDLLKKLIRDWIDSGDGSAELLDRDGAEQRARWLIEERFVVPDGSSLRLVEESMDGARRRAEFRFEGVEWGFDVVVAIEAGYVTVIETRRRPSIG